MNIGQIVKGHVNEFFGLNKNISEERVKICKKCPLYAIKMGTSVCNSSLWVNPKTGEISKEAKEGFKNGCGCRIYAKTTLLNASCPLNKW